MNIMESLNFQSRLYLFLFSLSLISYYLSIVLDRSIFKAKNTVEVLLIILVPVFGTYIVEIKHRIQDIEDKGK